MGLKKTINYIELFYRFAKQIADPYYICNGILGYLWYFQNLAKYKKKRNEKINWINFYPCIHDKGKHPFDSHYFYLSIWAFKHIADAGVKQHVDVGSQLNFAGLLSSITKITFVDLRPADINIDNFETKTGTVLNLPFDNHSIASLSSLHVIEHIGLGRYGDSLDPEGTQKAIVELSRVLASGGMLLIALPVGKPRICFNAHRISDPEDVVEWFNNQGLSLSHFSAVGDDKRYLPIAQPSDYKESKYACGLYCFTRK